MKLVLPPGAPDGGPPSGYGDYIYGLFLGKMKNLPEPTANTMILATAYATFYRNIVRSKRNSTLMTCRPQLIAIS